MLLASTSEVYGDPEVHPQPETYWGKVNSVGPRSCYDEGKRVAESLMVAYNKQAIFTIFKFFSWLEILFYEGLLEIIKNAILPFFSNTLRLF